MDKMPKRSIPILMAIGLSLILAGTASAAKRQYWYLDNDNDNFGDPATEVYTNKPAPGYILHKGDCNDLDPAINPDAVEICDLNDLTDENCSGNANEGCLAWWKDNDGDAYSTGMTIFDTAAPAGYVSEASLASSFLFDCNDDDPAINPAAEEIIGDQVDQDCNGASFFADVNLESCVLGYTFPSLNPEDLANLTDLGCDYFSIMDLRGMEYLTGLTHLALNFNFITDISSLAGLNQLTYLSLMFNNITDTIALGNLPGLTTLFLNYNPIGVIPSLINPAAITHLDLEGTLISDLTELAGYPGLTALNINSNSITDISPLNSSGLNILLMANNYISDLSPLAAADLTRMGWLDFSGNSITDVTPLSSLWPGCDLYAAYNCINDFSPVYHVWKINGINEQCL